MRNRFQRYRQRGQGAVEYAIILVLIAIFLIPITFEFRDSAVRMFKRGERATKIKHRTQHNDYRFPTHTAPRPFNPSNNSGLADPFAFSGKGPEFWKLDFNSGDQTKMGDRVRGAMGRQYGEQRHTGSQYKPAKMPNR